MGILGSKMLFEFDSTEYYGLTQSDSEGTANVFSTEASTAAGATTHKDAGANSWRVSASVVLETGSTVISALLPGEEAELVYYPEGKVSGAVTMTWTVAMVQSASVSAQVAGHTILDVEFECEGDPTVGTHSA